MCARRFLAVIFVLTLIVVAGAFAIFQFGGNVLLQEATPKGHFEAARAGGAPNYLEAQSWLASPNVQNDPSHWVPDGTTHQGRYNASVFYVHPTTYLLTDRWNAPLLPGGDTEFRTQLFVQSQASAFNGGGLIWSPRYRQAAFGAFLLKSDDAQKALDLAYSDVSLAFRKFLSDADASRPIILAGHSQGALHLLRLLVDYRKELKGRLAAAYIVGWPISITSDLPALGYPACTSPTQRGCILSWMSFGEPANPSLILDQWQKTKGLTGGIRRRQDILCVNPISGTQSGSAPAKDNPGTLAPSADLRSATLRSGAVGAHCENGLLMVDGNVPPLGPYVLPGNNYHVFDYALFWGAIRRDAERRTGEYHAGL